MWDTLIAVAAFLLVLGGLVYFRNRLKSKVEFSLTDILIAVVPVVLWLLLSGKISKFSLGDLTFETALVAASKENIATMVTQVTAAQPETAVAGTDLPIHQPSTATKGAWSPALDEAIPSEEPEGESQVPLEQSTQGQRSTRVAPVPHLQTGVEALILPLGELRFGAQALRNAVQSANAGDNLRYVLIVRGTQLVGVADASLFVSAGLSTFQALEHLLNTGTPDQWSAESWFLPVAEALSLRSSKLEALAQFEHLDRSWLPVVDEHLVFQGVVDRSKLTANLLLEVAKKLESR